MLAIHEEAGSCGERKAAALIGALIGMISGPWRLQE